MFSDLAGLRDLVTRRYNEQQALDRSLIPGVNSPTGGFENIPGGMPSPIPGLGMGGPGAGMGVRPRDPTGSTGFVPQQNPMFLPSGGDLSMLSNRMYGQLRPQQQLGQQGLLALLMSNPNVARFTGGMAQPMRSPQQPIGFSPREFPSGFSGG